MNAIQITSKLYDARDTMRSFWRGDYPKKVAEYQRLIRSGMAKYACDEIKATMKIVALLQEKEPDSGMHQALILAAYVEMIEPSKVDSGVDSGEKRGENKTDASH